MADVSDSKAAALSPRQRLSLAAAVLGGALLSLGLFFAMRAVCLDSLREQFERDANLRARVIEDKLHETLIDVDALRRFIEGAGRVERGQFRRFVAPVLARHGGMQALEWIPRVTAGERARFEAAIRATGFPDFQVRERDAHGLLVGAGDRAEYFPVCYAEPLAGNQKALGFDLGSEPIRRAALERARDSGALAVSERITLVQEAGSQHGFLLFAPVYADGPALDSPEARRAALRGFALGAFRIGDLLAAALATSAPLGLPFELLDPAAPEERRLLHRWESRLSAREGPLSLEFLYPAQPRAEHPVAFAGRSWRVDIEASEAYLAQHFELDHWLALPLGFGLTAVLALYLRALLLGRVRAEALAETRRRAEAEAQSQARFPDENPNPVLRVAAGGAVLYANKPGRALLLNLGGAVGQALPGPLSGPVAEAFAAGRQEQREIGVRDRVFSVFVTPIAAEGYTNLYGLDITERRKAEERVRENRELLSAILAGLNAAVVLVDYATLLVTDLNEVAQGLFEVQGNEVVGRPFGETIGARFKSKVRLGGADLPKVNRLNEEDLLIRRNGVPVPVLMHTLFVQMGGRDAVVIAVFDITERKALERQLTYAQKLESIGQLAAGIEHEINTPIQYVGDNIRFLGEAQKTQAALIEKLLVLAEEIKAGKDPSRLLPDIDRAVREADVPFLKEEMPKAVEQSIQGVERVGSIVRGIKKFSHPDVEEKVPYDINAAIENTVLVARNEWKYVAEADLDLDESLPLVRCLPGDFNQVILNLLVNAAHAVGDVMAKTGRMGHIRITSRRVGESVEIRVSDTGCGIPEENRSKIFNPFFTTKPVGKGTGQGLAITHNIVVAKHQGAIDFESEVGKGTTFIVTLPIGATGQEPEGADA